MKDSLINFILILVGNIFVAVAVTCFVVPNDILSGGIAGVAVALLPLFPTMDTTTFISIATVVLFIIGALTLGKGFFVKTLLSTLFYPIILNILDVMTEGMVFTDNQVIASIYTGIFLGVGVGLVFRTGSSTGGMDIPALIMEKYLHIPLPTSVLIIDALTVILGISTYSINAALIGLISVYVSSIVIDKTISFGGQKTKSVMIISEKYDEILSAIDKELDRGATLLHGAGGYKKDEKEVVLCVINNKQYPKLNILVHEIDENAFLIVQDAQEVHGNGFTYYKELESFSASIKNG